MPAKLDRCVAKLKRKGGVENPWAVCKASLGMTKKSKPKSKKKKKK